MWRSWLTVATRQPPPLHRRMGLFPPRPPPRWRRRRWAVARALPTLALVSVRGGPPANGADGRVRCPQTTVGCPPVGCPLLPPPPPHPWLTPLVAAALADCLCVRGGGQRARGWLPPPPRPQRWIPHRGRLKFSGAIEAAPRVVPMTIMTAKPSPRPPTITTTDRLPLLLCLVETHWFWQRRVGCGSRRVSAPAKNEKIKGFNWVSEVPHTRLGAFSFYAATLLGAEASLGRLVGGATIDSSRRARYRDPHRGRRRRGRPRCPTHAACPLPPMSPNP